MFTSKNINVSFAQFLRGLRVDESEKFPCIPPAVELEPRRSSQGRCLPLLFAETI
jgi:hypothetical protein